MSDLEKALQGWTHYWNPQVAESFGGKEELEKNPKYVFEEKPISDSIPMCDALLDAGAGVGRYTQLVKDKCKLYMGVDYSLNMLEQARRNNPFPNVVYVQGDLETIDLPTVLKNGWIKMGFINEDTQLEHPKFDVGMLIAIIRHLPTEKGLAVLKHVADACDSLFFTASIVPEEREIPMIVKGIGDNKIVDHPYHLSDIKKTLNTETLNAVPIGDRDPTEGVRYLFKHPFDVSLVPSSTKKPWNRLVNVWRTVRG